MADLQFGDFAFMPGPVRKERQSRLPDDFSNIDVTILSQTSQPAYGFPAIFPNTDGPLFGDPQTRAKQEISTFPLLEPIKR